MPFLIRTERLNDMKVQLLDRDLAILNFLWRFKFAPTGVLASKFFADAEWNAYMRLYRLSRAGYIESLYPKNGIHHFWSLSKDGFEIVKSELPELAQDGFRSENIEHDLLVLAAQIGFWLKDIPGNVSLVTEQELRRIKPELYQSGVPTSPIHRPDGYWLFKNAEKTQMVALEVERSQKAKEIYDSVARFYYKDAYVDQVIWIVDTREQAKRMLKRFQEVVSENYDIHSFVLIKDFVKQNWQAPIIIGKDHPHTIHETLVNKSQTNRKHIYECDFFDTRKNPKDSRLNQKRQTLFKIN